MDVTLLMLSLLFGIIGSAMFMYGRKAERMPPLITGMALVVVPYFIPNAIALLVVCCGLMSIPWLMREG